MNHKLCSTLVFVALLCLPACGSSEKAATPAPTSPPSATLAAQPTQAAPPTAAPQATDTQAAPAAPGPGEERDFGQASDLSGLNSYRVNYTYTWESTQEGQTEHGSWTMEQEVVRQPAASRMRWSSSEAGQDTSLEILEVEGKVYWNSGSGWMEVASPDQAPLQEEALLSDPLGILSGSQGRLVERGVTVDGVRTDHYALDQTNFGAGLGLGTIATAQGDAWVSTDYGVVIRYQARFEGQELVIAGGEAGVLEMAFDLTDLNQPIVITAPEEFQAAMPEDIPMLDDAAEVSAMMGMVTYKTARSVDEVSAFYDAQMPLRGWTKEGGFGGMSTFSKGDQTAQVIIVEESGQTTVTVAVSQQ